MARSLERIKIFFKDLWKWRSNCIMILPGVIWYIVFAYIPIYGLTLAFKSYRANLGIFRSPWVGLENYVYVFRDPAFLESIWRTLFINFGRILFQFPYPIILALLLNELRINRFKKAIQTSSYLSSFLILGYCSQYHD